MHLTSGAVLAAVFWMLGVAVGNGQWYTVPASGTITFTLTEQWGVFKGLPSSSFVEGDATITVEYLDGSTEQIAFQDSGPAVSGALVPPQNSAAVSVFGAGELSGTSVWTQTALLTAGRVFQIVSSSPAQSYAQDLEFQGGTGAFVKGFVTKFSTDAPPLIQPSGPPTSTLPPPRSIPVGAPSNIHAVIVSGQSDPAKVIVSPNVTLTGGIIALGKNPLSPSTPTAWSPGLKIVPDYALLTGEKIPPITPNILDVRIARHEVTAEFPSPNPQPSD